LIQLTDKIVSKAKLLIITWWLSHDNSLCLQDMAMMPSVTAGNPYENDPIIEQDLIDPDGGPLALYQIRRVNI
jgi:hypothetical protein